MNNEMFRESFVRLLIGRIEGACENRLKPSQRRRQLTDRREDPEGAPASQCAMRLLGIALTSDQKLRFVERSPTHTKPNSGIDFGRRTWGIREFPQILFFINRKIISSVGDS